VVGKSKWGLVRGKERREERSRIGFQKGKHGGGIQATKKRKEPHGLTRTHIVGSKTPTPTSHKRNKMLVRKGIEKTYFNWLDISSRLASASAIRECSVATLASRLA